MIRRRDLGCGREVIVAPGNAGCTLRSAGTKGRSRAPNHVVPCAIAGSHTLDAGVRAQTHELCPRCRLQVSAALVFHCARPSTRFRCTPTLELIGRRARGGRGEVMWSPVVRGRGRLIANVMRANPWLDP